MKRIFWLIILILFLNLHGFSQGIPQLNTQYTFNVASTTTGINVSALGLGFWKIHWANAAITVPSACTIVLQASPDNSTWSTITSQTCTSPGESSLVANSPIWYRLNLSTYTPATATSVLDVNVEAWNDASSSNSAINISGSGMIEYNDYTSNVVKNVSTTGFTTYSISAGCNTNTSVGLFIQLFNALAANVSLGSTTPTLAYDLPCGSAGGGNNPQMPVMGLPWSTALSWACTTTGTGSTGASAVCHLSILGKYWEDFIGEYINQYTPKWW